MSATGRGADDVAVDIVVNNYNYGRYVGDAVESARAQTHPRVQVIVVDDGSDDDSRQVLERFEDVDVVLKENGGQASAVNAGFALCRGDAVIFLDADDRLHPEAAARVAAAIAAEPEVAKIQYRLDVIDGAGRPTGEVKPHSHWEVANGDMRAAELAYPYDLGWMATSGNAFRTEALRRIMPIPEAEYPVCGADWYLVHLATLLGEVRSLGQPLGDYRVHGANNYQPEDPQLDLDHVRQAVVFADSTSRELLRLAAELGLPRPRRVLSLADLANRLISLRLDPGNHPLPEDTIGDILRDAVGAARRRRNASPAMRLMLLGWFAATAAAPRPLARRLSILLLFPERRPGLNSLLRQLQRRDGEG
jgi:cellulose synthase/poly-beta-1,6-N-acetylglucosamine synthase-like glycosyltransferase